MIFRAFRLYFRLYFTEEKYSPLIYCHSFGKVETNTRSPNWFSKSWQTLGLPLALKGRQLRTNLSVRLSPGGQQMTSFQDLSIDLFLRVIILQFKQFDDWNHLLLNSVDNKTGKVCHSMLECYNRWRKWKDESFWRNYRPNQSIFY